MPIGRQDAQRTRQFGHKRRLSPAADLAGCAPRPHSGPFVRVSAVADPHCQLHLLFSQQALVFLRPSVPS